MIPKFAKHLTFVSLATFGSLTAALSIPIEDEKAIQSHFADLAKEPGSVIFTPPTGWFLADPNALPPNVKVMVVGKGNSEYPPSLNLTTEKYSGTLKQYLKIVKSINDSKGDEWKDLGTIRTEAGEGSLSQVDIKSKFGTERLMHVILQKEGTIYILTAAALKNEFPKYYKDFFNSMRSLRINKNNVDPIQQPAQKTDLQNQVLEQIQGELY